MLIKGLMAEVTVDPEFTGVTTNDDMVLAVDCSDPITGAIEDYAVVQVGIAGIDSSMNPTTAEKTYIRTGTTTTKTGNQRTFSITGDRIIGDEFQDFALSHKIKYGKGQAVMRDYIYFNLITGKGEKGLCSIIVNSDGSGEAGNSSEIDIELKSTGAAPEEFAWDDDTPITG
jgi:hypothetical protein